MTSGTTARVESADAGTGRGQSLRAVFSVSGQIPTPVLLHAADDVSALPASRQL